MSNWFNRPKDVELPNESGKVDRRLPKSWATEKVQLQNAGRQMRRSVEAVKRSGLVKKSR